MTRKEIKEKTSLVEYLAFEGCHPTYNKGGGKLRYKAVWHNGDNPNTISVDANANLWYDHSHQVGGSVVELCMVIHKCDEAEALQILTKYNGGDVEKVAPIIPDESKTSKASVRGVYDVNNDVLINYFRKDRCIDVKWLHAYCKQIFYTIEGRETKFYAVAMQNLSGGWAYRTAAPTGKGCVGIQDITVVPFVNAPKYMVFEGFTNFLSFLTLHGRPSVNVIILNSVSNTNKAISYLMNHKPSALYLLLDNDTAGDNATQNIIRAFGIAQDKRSHYAQFNDLNDYLKDKHGK